MSDLNIDVSKLPEDVREKLAELDLELSEGIQGTPPFKIIAVGPRTTSEKKLFAGAKNEGIFTLKVFCILVEMVRGFGLAGELVTKEMKLNANTPPKSMEREIMYSKVRFFVKRGNLKSVKSNFSTR
ncbi:hypothetical protein ABEB36_000680 [Hypothenemus hampei]|uniref:Uncharacterized protein n=1 Tax=Hypothenemus hampei TaxID=57062 RepID=A0ABD1FC43_HYPHA